MKSCRIKFLLRNKKNSEIANKAIIYCRIIIGNERREFSTGKKIQKDRWNQISGSTCGKSYEEKEINEYLKSLIARIYGIEKNILLKGNEVNLKSVFEELNPTVLDKTEHFLINIANEHNSKYQELRNKKLIARETLGRYRITVNYLKSFLINVLNQDDIALNQIGVNFISQFDHFLKITTTNKINSNARHLKNLKRFLNYAVEMEYIKSNPLSAFKCKSEPVAREYLTKAELGKIKELKIDLPRLKNTQYLFLLSCYTGLSYADLKTLKKENLSQDEQGRKWIIKPRNKTKVMSRIPLLQVAHEYLNYLIENSFNNENLLLVKSNVHVNAYLKEIAGLAGITKNLTFHMARHTFATTVTLANGVSLEAVSAQLGHTNLRQTQHYARMINDRIGNEMDQLNRIHI